MYNKNISPIDWYVCTYQLRFIEIEHTKNFNEDARFLAWENTILVKAKNLDEAYDKTTAFALENTQPYKGGDAGINVQWIFEGIVDILPIYEEFADGSEIIWTELKSRKLKNLRKRVSKSKEDFFKNNP